MTEADVEAMQRHLHTALETLMEIAAYGDAGGNAHLRATGSYSCFDEPHSVQKARAAIDAIGGPAPERS